MGAVRQFPPLLNWGLAPKLTNVISYFAALFPNRGHRKRKMSSNNEASPPSSQPAPPRRERVEYYAETQFKGVDLSRNVHLGWGVAGGASA